MVIALEHLDSCLVEVVDTSTLIGQICLVSLEARFFALVTLIANVVNRIKVLVPHLKVREQLIFLFGYGYVCPNQFYLITLDQGDDESVRSVRLTIQS